MIFVFSKQWFERHQTKLLFFTNTPFGKWVLGIQNGAVKGRKITNISPSHYVIENGTDSLGRRKNIAAFQVGDVFGYRLYKSFKYFWYTLHFIDWVFNFVPEPRLRLNFGFDTVTYYPVASPNAPLDGVLVNGPFGVTFPTLIGAASGTFVSTTNNLQVELKSDTVTDNFDYINRGVACFDTSGLSALLGSYNYVVGADLKLVNTTKGNNIGLSNVHAGIDIVESTIDNDGTLVLTDFSAFGTTSFSHLDYDEITSSGQVSFPLNLDGLAFINKTGFTKFQVKMNVDFAAGTPAWSSNALTFFNFKSVDADAGANKPEFVVEYISTEFGESVGVGDALGKTPSKTFAESINIADSTVISRIYLREIYETITALDSFESQFKKNFTESISLLVELYGVGSELRKKTNISPVWILKCEFATGTLYLSDQEFYLDNWDITTTPWIKTWNELDMDISDAGFSLITPSDISLEFINEQDNPNNFDELFWSSSNKPEAVNCELHLWVKELAGDDKSPILFWSGNFLDYRKTDELTYDVQLIDSSKRFEYNVGSILDIVEYPNADPDDVGKMKPIVYGDVDHVPALAIDAGWATTVSEDLNNSVTTFNISDASGLSDGDVIQVEDEQILIGTISENILQSCTRGYSSTTATTHDKGIQLGKIQTEYWYLVADHPVKSIGDVYVDGVRQVGGDFTKYPDHSGQAKIKFTALPVLKKSVDVEVDDNVKVQDYTLSHDDGINQDASKMTNQNTTQEWDWTSGFSTSEVKTIAKFDHPGYTYSEATYTVNCRINIYATTSDVTVYARLNTVVSGGGGGTVGPWMPIMFWKNDGLGFNFYTSILQTFSALSSGDSYLEVKVTSGNPSGCSYFETISVTRTIKADASVVGTGVSSKVDAVKAKISGAKSYYIGLTGNSSADMVIGTLITANVEGYEDDGSGTYTGTPNALIERPDHVFKHFLDAYGGVTNFTTDAGSSFSSKGYKFAGILDTQQSFKDWLAMFAWQCRCYFRFYVGTAELIFRPDSLISSKNVRDEDIRAEEEFSTLVGPSPSPLDEVINVINLKYDRDWTTEGAGSYQGIEEDSDSVSIERYGEKEKAELFFFDFIRDASMASSLVSFYLLRYKNRKKDFELDVMLDFWDVTFGMGITLSELGLLCEVKKVNVYPGSGEEERNDRIHLIVREW